MQVCVRKLGKVLDGLTAEAKERLLSYRWPGNYQELQNVLERAVVLSHGTQLEIPDELLSEGPKLGSYTLVRQLGSGAMGDVWLARHALLARPAAVKIIRKQALSGHPEQQNVLRKRFEQEAKATALLRSPHTVDLYDFGITEDGVFYYVMEYLEGLDLDTLVERFGSLPPERAVYLLLQATDSLSEAHNKDLVHRDLKPSNLHVSQVGLQSDFLKVLDFGLVKVEQESEAESTKVTQDGSATGTPAYMAPEMVLRNREIDERSDIYSLGCVAYWMLTGRLVFEGKTAMEMMFDHVRTIPVPPSKKIDTDVPGELDEVVLACLEKDPDKRPANTRELARRLSDCPMADRWTQKEASSWWETHSPLSELGPAASTPPSTSSESKAEPGPVREA
jgi:serine/threonine-protein kinase